MTNFDNDDDIMKAIMGGGGGGGNIDDELAALEAEIGDKKGGDDELAALENELDEEDKPKAKPKGRKKSDDDLAALEKEGLDDVDSDEEKKKSKKPPVQTKKPEPKKEPPKPQPKKEEPKPTTKKEEPKPTTKKEDVPKGPDLYPEKTEQKYHNVNKMTSIGVLNDEKELCDKIIEYKKKIGADYDDWEIKKDSIEDKIGTVSSFVQDGVWDLNAYKKKIMEQYKWEVKLLQFVEQDPTLNDQQKKVLKDRVTKRKEIIDTELKQEPEEGEEEEAPKKEEPKKEETKKEDNKKEEKKTEKLEMKKSLSPMFSVPKDKEEEEKKRINDVVVDRLNEYRAALDYFKSNELAEQRLDATNKAKLICIELKKIQDGKWKEVNEFKLPDPVTPEYIYGYKKEERNERFKKIILDYDKQRKEVTAEINAKIEVFKKMPPAKFKKIKDAATKDLNAMKARKENFDKLINLLKQYYQDSWTPAPLFVEQDKEIKSEKVDKDIPEFQLRIIFGKTTYNKDKSIYLIVRYPEKNLEKKFEQKKPGNWEQQIDWKFDKSDFKAIYRNKFHVEIWEKRFLLKDTLKGQFEMEPKELKNQLEVTKDWKITLEDGKTDQTAQVTFKVHSPCKEPVYSIDTKQVLQVTKIYKPFNLKGNNANQSAIKMDIQTPQVSLSASNNTPQATPTAGGKRPVKPQAQAPKPKPGGKPGAGAAPKKPQGAPIDKSQFKEEELNDPDCLDCLNTLSVLQFKQNKYEEIRNKIDGRTPRELMQRIVRIKCKYQTLEESLGDEISPQDYLTLLKVTFDHDKKLAEYFKQIGDKEKFILVNERLPLIFKETEELMKQMPK